MEFVTEIKNIRISARKIRLIADAIRKMSVEKALLTLALMRQRGAISLRKALESAVSNAVNNGKQDRQNLSMKYVEVLEGTFLKRYRPSTKGRTHPYKKRSCHIKITLTERSGYGKKS